MIYTDLIQYITKNRDKLNLHMDTQKLLQMLDMYATGDSEKMLEISQILTC